MRKIVKTKWVVSVPDGAEVKVGLGVKVNKGEVLFVWMAGVSSRVSMLSHLSHLSKEKWGEIREKFVGKDLALGEEMADKITSPRSGVLKGIDEFGNMEFFEKSNEEEVVSPVSAKVVKVEPGKIALEFKAMEIKGESLVDGKMWGEMSFATIDTDTDLTYKNKGEIVMLEKLESHMVLKSEVIGAGGLLTVSEKFDGESDIPILKVGRTDWDFLSSKRGKGRRDVLLSSKNGRLLIVIE